MKVFNIGNDNALALKLRSVKATPKTETSTPKAEVAVNEPVKEEAKNDTIEATKEPIQESEQGAGGTETTEEPGKQQANKGVAKKGK